jgi:hypothetical protein
MVPDTEFTSRWIEIETVIKRTQQWSSSQGLVADYNRELARIKNKELGSEVMQQYKLVLEGMMLLLQKTENAGQALNYGVFIV